ncbi:MAG: phosphohistidine phosphatase SixA, partial [Acidobacteria bacterium]|nr:phosphohistidine phosphatase SixA [Acidobacteriota bacterium]
MKDRVSTMEIYLLRHGIAEDPRPGMDDADRALTAEGRKKLREVLLVARDAGVKPDVIMTSPYRRAKETAEIAREILRYKEEIESSQALVPIAEAREAWDGIRVHKDAGSLLLSSHEPLTGLLAAYLLGAPGLQVDVKKGSIVRIDVGSFGPQ